MGGTRAYANNAPVEPRSRTGTGNKVSAVAILGVLFVVVLLRLAVERRLLHQQKIERTYEKILMVRQQQRSALLARKLSQPPSTFDTNLVRNISFVHVGKASGMTIRYSLKVPREDCAYGRREASVPNGGLANAIQSCHHIVVRELDADATLTSFLFSIREPIARLVSSFYFNHYINNNYHQKRQANKGGHVYAFYHYCFPSINDLTLAVSGSKDYHVVQRDNPTNSDTIVDDVPTESYCRDLGFRALQGKKPKAAVHMYCNYGFYANVTVYKEPNNNNSKEVLVIRSEHLEHDMLRLDKWMGGTLTTLRKTVTHGSENFTMTTPISKEGARILCCVTYQDIAVYQDLVNRATNLHPVEKDTTMKDTYQACGIDIEGSDRRVFSWAAWYNQSCPHGPNQS